MVIVEKMRDKIKRSHKYIEYVVLKLVVFGSGRGSNFQSIQESIEEGNLEATINMVISNEPNAGIIEKSKNARINSMIIPHHEIDRKQHEDHILEFLEDVEFDLVVLAGYMRILTKHFIDEIGVPIVNIHPSLLPAFPGLEAQKQALDHGVKVSGVTIHQVNEDVDGGKILDQKCVRVHDNDTVESLSQRILEEEHKLYPKVLQKIKKSKIQLD